MSHFINSIPLWFILTALLLFLPLCIVMGYWLAHYCKGHEKEYTISDSIPTSILGVHALLIGFTFSMAISRFEARRELVVKESNAIGTAYLRAKTLPQPYNAQTQDLFYKYLKTQIRFGKLVHGQAEIQTVLNELKQIQTQLWGSAQQMTTKYRSPLEAIYLSSLNEVIDLHSERVQAIRNQLPPTVIGLLLITVAMALVSLGFVESVKKRKSTVWLFILSTLFSIVITLIIDIDRPRRGLITVPQTPMEELYESVRAELGK